MTVLIKVTASIHKGVSAVFVHSGNMVMVKRMVELGCNTPSYEFPVAKVAIGNPMFLFYIYIYF